MFQVLKKRYAYKKTCVGILSFFKVLFVKESFTVFLVSVLVFLVSHIFFFCLWYAICLVLLSQSLLINIIWLYFTCFRSMFTQNFFRTTENFIRYCRRYVHLFLNISFKAHDFYHNINSLKNFFLV